MIDSKKIFIDTNIFIYLIEDVGELKDISRSKIVEYANNGYQFCTSTVTTEEYLVYAFKSNNIDLYNKFFKLKEVFNIDTINIVEPISIKAAELRAKYISLKAFDALQIASAIENECSIFLTNDKGLHVVTEIEYEFISK